MNILFYLYRYPGWGGIETVTSTITSELIEQGHEVFILSETWQDNKHSFIDGLKIIHLPYELEDIDRNIAFIDEFVKKNDFDFLVYQDCYVPNEKIPIEISKRNKIPLIVFEHNTPTRFKNIRYIDNPYSAKGIIKTLFYPFFRQRYIRWDIARKKELYNNCTKYVLLSKSYVQEIKQLLNINTLSNKFEYLYNPCPYNPNTIATHKEVGSMKINEIVSVGRLEKNKCVDKLLKVWKQVNSHCPEYRLTIVGDGAEKENLINLSKRLGLQNVSFEGFQNPIPYYRRAKIFLMASKFEGWPMTIIEAMAYGCVPIVENNFSALNDMIEDGVSGKILSKNTKVRNWSKCIISTIRNHDDLRKMSENDKTVIERFCVDSIVHSWINLFNAIKKCQ